LAGWIFLTALPGHATPVSAGDYLMDLWTIENDLPDSSVTAIAQTPEGYLWVGTYNGLARFDGVRFVTFDPFNTPALKHARVDGLFVDAQGTLWINTRDGSMTSRRNGVFTREWQGGQVSAVLSSSNQIYFALLRGELVCRTETPGGAGNWKSINLAGPTTGNSFCKDRTEALWYLLRDGTVGRIVGNESRPVANDNNLAGQKVSHLTTDPSGRIWIGTDKEIAVWNGEHFENQTPTNGEPQLNVSYFFCTASNGCWVFANNRARKCVNRQWVSETTALQDWTGINGGDTHAYEDQAGGVWFRHYGLGLYHIQPDGRAQRFSSANGLPGDRVGCWFWDPEDNLWVGVGRGGLVRLREKRFRVLDSAEGLPAQAAASVCEDSRGDIWIGTFGGGLIRWRNGTPERFNLNEGNYRGFFFSIYPDQQNRLWLSAGREDLFTLDKDQITPSSSPAHGIKAMRVDRKGRVWLGRNSGLSCYTDGGLRNYTSTDGIERTDIRAIAEDRQGVMWFGAGDGNLYELNKEKITAHRTADNLGSQAIWSLLPDEDGTLWVGTFRGGLLRFKDGTFTRYTTASGLPNDIICQILDDGLGKLWIGSHKGIFNVPKAALHEMARGVIKTLPCMAYGTSDGLPTRECSGGYQPSAWRSRDGRLWFATIRGVVSIHPAEIFVNRRPPQVVLEEILVDGRPPDEETRTNGLGRAAYSGAPPAPAAPNTATLTIPPGRSQFFFRYTGLSFAAPDNIRFRYRLEGVDREWVEAGTRRWAQYSHLKPGDYRFRVTACNNSGVWNETGASVSLKVLPHFWETWWFIGLAGAVTVGTLAGTIRVVATGKLRRKLALLEQQRAIERDRTRIAKDIHDDLGAGLTQIMLQSALARRNSQPETHTHLEQISGTAQELIRDMDEIVWAVDPQNDTLDGLITYLCKFTQEYLTAAGLRCRLDVPAQLPARALPAEARHNLFLAVKETLNNVLKHARATEVLLELNIAAETFTLVIKDNGHGFAPNGPFSEGAGSLRVSSGHGVGNLVERLEAIGGRCLISSEPEKGTRVEFTVKYGPGNPAEFELGRKPVVGESSSQPDE
jgi:signal transduction histidine kinase/ligand-binding sensor domain-containing protein